MKRRLLQFAVLAGAVALPSFAAAQFPAPPAPAGRTPVQDRWPGAEPAPAQPAPQQPQSQQQPSRQTAPAPRQARPKMDDDDDAPKQAPKPRAAAAPANAVTCGGTFAKDATHLKLAIKFDSRNIVFGEVDGPEGSKIKATILFPNEPKRRLEVIWNNDAARTDLSMVVINGQSQWTAPRGLKVGTPLAALEKTNGRPFKLSFGADGTASVLGWEGGALSSLPGGCKVGIRLAADTKTAAAVAGKEVLSNDANLKAGKASIAEILIGY